MGAEISGERSDAARANLRELSGFAAPWAISIAATLRLADHLEAGPIRLEELAERACADPEALGRLLRYLVAQGVFTEESGNYENTDISRLLLDEAGWRPWLNLDDAPGVWAESWTRLLTAVRSGSPGRDEAGTTRSSPEAGAPPRLTLSWRRRYAKTPHRSQRSTTGAA